MTSAQSELVSFAEIGRLMDCHCGVLWHVAIKEFLYTIFLSTQHLYDAGDISPILATNDLHK